jgi:hypothetical protein
VVREGFRATVRISAATLRRTHILAVAAPALEERSGTLNCVGSFEMGCPELTTLPFFMTGFDHLSVRWSCVFPSASWSGQWKEPCSFVPSRLVSRQSMYLELARSSDYLALGGHSVSSSGLVILQSAARACLDSSFLTTVLASILTI